MLLSGVGLGKEGNSAGKFGGGSVLDISAKFIHLLQQNTLRFKC